MTVYTLFSLLHSKERPIQKEETIYGNWMDTMVTICEEITTESLVIVYVSEVMMSASNIYLL